MVSKILAPQRSATSVGVPRFTSSSFENSSRARATGGSVHQPSVSHVSSRRKRGNRIQMRGTVSTCSSSAQATIQKVDRERRFPSLSLFAPSSSSSASSASRSGRRTCSSSSFSSSVVMSASTTESNPSPNTSSGREEAEVEELVGVRLVRDQESGKPTVQYMVKWQDDYQDSWEDARNLSEDLLRRYEDDWWGAVKKGNYEKIVTMLIGGREALVSGVDNDRRSALHYACGTGNVKCTKLLLVNGAEVDLRDKDGYTPLHIASGYMHKEVVSELLASGADPEIKDKTERSALELVESLRDNLPANNPTVFARRLALGEVIKELTENLYEEVTPKQILRARKRGQKDEEKEEEEEEEKEKDPMEMLKAELAGGDISSESNANANADAEAEGKAKAAKGDTAEAEVLDLEQREFLVQWEEEDLEDTWVPLKHMAEDVLEDFDNGLEYAEAIRIVEKRPLVDSNLTTTASADDKGKKEEEKKEQAEEDTALPETETFEYLIEWSDGYENSWEPREHVSDDLIQAFDQGQDLKTQEREQEAAEMVG